MFVKLIPSVLRVILVDVNRSVVDAWRSAFADVSEVEIVHGSILDQRVDAWVTPTNARGRMDGGVDAAIRRHLGASIQRGVRREIKRVYEGHMPVGCATCVATGVSIPRFVISTPTMVQSAEDVSETMNPALACAAAFQAIHTQNASEPDSITSVALPGLGAATGRVSPRLCAELMRKGYGLVNDGGFPDFGALRSALLEHLGAPLEMMRMPALISESPFLTR